MTSRIAADRLEGGRGNKVSSSSPIATPWKTYQVGYMTTQVLHLSWSLRPPNFPGRNLVGRLITFIVRTNGPARACSRHRSGSDLCSLVRAFALASFARDNRRQLYSEFTSVAGKFYRMANWQYQVACGYSPKNTSIQYISFSVKPSVPLYWKL